MSSETMPLNKSCNSDFDNCSVKQAIKSGARSGGIPAVANASLNLSGLILPDISPGSSSHASSAAFLICAKIKITALIRAPARAACKPFNIILLMSGSGSDVAASSDKPAVGGVGTGGINPITASVALKRLLITC